MAVTRKSGEVPVGVNRMVLSAPQLPVALNDVHDRHRLAPGQIDPFQLRLAADARLLHGARGEGDRLGVG